MNKSGEEKNNQFYFNKKNNIIDNKQELNFNDNIEKNNDSNQKEGKNQKSNNNQPIFIFNCKCDNNYYKINDKSKKCIKTKKSSKLSKKAITCNNEAKPRNKRKQKTSKNNNLNEEKNWPGDYNLILINANNSSNKKPPQSKFILDNYYYEQAIKYDKREFWRILFICLLSKEKILNTFFFHSPLEVQTLRLSIFLFSYSCDFALNALFYLNDNISDKYHYDGESLYLYLLVNNIVITIFSTVFSYVIVESLNCLTNSKESIKEIFRNEEKMMRKNKKYKLDKEKKKNIENNILKIFKCLKIKIICYIIIELLIMVFFFYFLTAFCEVYKDTQSSWLYDSFISFLLSIPFEFLISFIISLLYIISLTKKLKCMYNVSMFLYKIG